GEALFAWFASLAQAGVEAAGGRLDGAVAALAAGAPMRRASGDNTIGWSSTLLVLDRIEEAGLSAPGYVLDAEIDRLVAAPSPHLRGLGHRFRARRALRRGGGAASATAREDQALAAEALRAAGARHDLQQTLLEAASLAEAEGRPADAAALRHEADDAWRPPARSPGDEPVDLARRAAAIVDLGGLVPSGERLEGFWGDVAAHLCRAFAVERCAVAELGAAGPALLGARGDARWQSALLDALRGPAPGAVSLGSALAAQGSPPAGGRLSLAPFESRRTGRKGVVALESAVAAEPSPAEPILLAALGRQVGVLADAVAARQEITQARRRLEHENRYYREAGPAAAPAGGRLLGGSPAMREVLELVARAAPSSTPVLVTGETGVGKELVSREIHLRSARRDGPFIAVHVASLSPGLVASALFGHERGAFTGATEMTRGRFELADGGTLFLDEVGELSPEDQVRLLRVLQEGAFERVGGSRTVRSDFRLVAATNRDLQADVAAGRFREDLFFRLSAFPIRVPPLRGRREEIPRLALLFMERAAKDRGVRFEGIGEADMARLIDYPWPGNVRELQHVISRAALLSDPPRLRIPPLDPSGSPRARGGSPSAETPPAVEPLATLESVEREHIRRVLHRVGGRVSGPGGAAEVLGLKPTTLQFWIGKLGLRGELARARKAGPTPPPAAAV
ncbi:MAG TPA: sigma-54 dependent transcriptional regulator, partial [Anaeromyxobacteraceae bacterium]|nr:sigma-54 dependent transcriptional regulator [Anaeromyxobacteraceae bacterium]